MIARMNAYIYIRPSDIKTKEKGERIEAMIQIRSDTDLENKTKSIFFSKNNDII